VKHWSSDAAADDHAEDDEQAVRPLLDPLDLDPLVVELLVEPRQRGLHAGVTLAHAPVDRVLGVNQLHVGIEGVQDGVYLAAAERGVEVVDAPLQGGVHGRSLV
jgi:hypothetical protein